MSIDTYENPTSPGLGPARGPKIQTIIEVLRCELARPKSTSPSAQNSEAQPEKGWTPVHYAAYRNREAALRHFLRASQSPDGNGNAGATPLCVAVSAGHISMVNILCEGGADVNVATKDKGETALHLAIRIARTDIMDLLLSYEPTLEATTSTTKETPLHYAASKSGSLAAVVALLRSGASIEARNSQGCTPAEVAIQSQNIHAAVAIVSAARGKRSQLAKEKDMLLRHVEKAQNRFSMNNELIADIFEAGCDPKSTVLIEAVKKNDSSLAEMFLEKGADANRCGANGIRPIFAALACSSAQMVYLLVKHGADVTERDHDGLTVLQAALESPSAHDKEAIMGIFDALLSKGADPLIKYADGKTLVHHAVAPSLGLARVAQRLIQRGVDVNAVDKSGSTALHLASYNRSCIDVLLKHGATVDLVNKAGLTPLLSAVTIAVKTDEPDLDALIKASNLRTLAPDQQSALHIAAHNGLEKTVRILLKCHAETTVLDAQDHTPLLAAVLNHQWNVVPLLATQPGINMWDEAGMTALHHVVTATPQSPSTWKDIALAAAKFCERGVSRSMRDKSGATPLIQAVKTLPEDGLPVIEVLLAEKGPARGNCVAHEDHKQRSALHFAATKEKPIFVQALLRGGASFSFQDWTLNNGLLKPTTKANKAILSSLAEHEWLCRIGMLQRRPGCLPELLPLNDLTDMLAMGLNPDAVPILPRIKSASTLLWTILNQTLCEPPLPQSYLSEMITVAFAFNANPNSLDAKKRHPLTFLLEQQSTIDIDILMLFFDKKVNPNTESAFYEGRYPLHSAVKANRLDVVDELLSRKADTNVADAKGRTPLFTAAEGRLWEVVDLLLKRRPNLESRDTDGNTALHAAAKGGCARIILSLLRAGAKAFVQNSKGDLPLACVPANLSEKDHTKITAMLKNAAEQDRRDQERNQRQAEFERRALEQEKKRIEREQSEKARLEKERADRKMVMEREQAEQKKKQALEQEESRKRLEQERAEVKKNLEIARKASKKSKSKWRQSTNRQSSLSPEPPTLPPIAATTTTTTTLNTDKPLPIPEAKKPLNSPRVDSGIGMSGGSKRDEIVYPTLDPGRITFDNENKAQNKGQGEDEDFSDWLAMSKLLGQL